jgi:hypothetical protein
MTHRGITNPYLRKMLAGELVGIRNFRRKSGIDPKIIHWMRCTADTCFDRINLHVDKWGVGILTGESEGLFDKDFNFFTPTRKR